MSNSPKRIVLAVRRMVSGQQEPRDYLFAFEQEEVILGRSTCADICLPHPSVSLSHARIEVDADDYYISDLESTNGTWMDGRQVPPGCRQVYGLETKVRLGQYLIEVVSPDHQPAEAMPRQSTASYARQMIRDVLDDRSVDKPGVSSEADVFIEAVNGVREGERWEILPDKIYVIGRGDECDVVFPDPDMSRRHAKVVRTNEGTLISDLGSKNGVRVDGEGVFSSCHLEHDSEILIGETRLRLVDRVQDILDRVQSGPDLIDDVVDPLKPAASGNIGYAAGAEKNLSQDAVLELGGIASVMPNSDPSLPMVNNTAEKRSIAVNTDRQMNIVLSVIGISVIVAALGFLFYLF